MHFKEVTKMSNMHLRCQKIYGVKIHVKLRTHVKSLSSVEEMLGKHYANTQEGCIKYMSDTERAS